MSDRLRRRLEKLEEAIKPEGCVFYFWDDSNQYENYNGPDLDTHHSLQGQKWSFAERRDRHHHVAAAAVRATSIWRRGSARITRCGRSG